jgi:hypothetical protein
MYYDRNSYPRLIGDGMSKLTGSVAEGCKQCCGGVQAVCFPEAGSGLAPRSHRTDLEARMARVSAVIVGVDLRRAQPDG